MREKIWHKIPERVSHAVKYNTSFFFCLFIYLQPSHNTNTTQKRKISYNTKIKRENISCIQQINTEKLSEGEEVRVRPTLGSRLSRYWVMVHFQGGLSGQNSSIV